MQDLRRQFGRSRGFGMAFVGVQLTLSSFATTTLAQTASQITPPAYHAPQAVPEAGPDVSKAAPEALPDELTRLSVRIDAVQIDGGLGVMAKDHAHLIEALSGKIVTAAQILGAAQDLEQAYARAGFILVRVAVPAQDLVDGATLKVLVVDGYLEAIETAGVSPYLRRPVDRTMAPLRAKRGLRLERIERQLMVASDLPGVRLRSTLAPGTALGASRLVLEADYQPIGGFVSFDNSVGKALGGYQAGVGFDFNSVTGHGEHVYVRAFGDPVDGSAGFGGALPRNRAYSVGAQLPFGSGGVSLIGDVTLARATPEPDLGELGFTSDFRRASVRLRAPLVRTRARTLSAEVGFEAENEALDVIAPTLVPISLDKLRVVRATLDGETRLAGGGYVSGSLTATLGLDAFGARSARDATALLPLSRQGADAAFQKLEVSAHYSQALTSHLVFDGQVRAQTAFGKALSRIEQVGFASADALSPAPAGGFQGDSGFGARAEVRAPLSLAVHQTGLSITPYAFIAHAEVSLSQPTALEAAHVAGNAFGAGFRLGLAAKPYISLAVEWGRQARSDDPTPQDRLRVSSGLSF